MKKILSVSDSYEGTHLDVKRAITTIKAFEMDPFIAVSEFIRSDGSSDPIDIKETLDYCFEDCTPDAVFIGFIREARHAAIVASVIASHSPSIIVSDPSIISDKGEVWMTEETYNVISTSIFDMSTHIIINHLEAELLSGFECNDRMDFERAARKLHNCFHAAVYIKGCSKTSCKGLFCDDTGITWVDDDRSKARPELSLGNALNCELALGTRGLKAITNALFFTVNGRRVSESIPVPQVAPSLISPAKSLRDIARSIDTQPQTSVQPKPAKTSIIDPVTEGTKGTVSELKAPEKAPARSIGDSLSELAEIRKRLEALKKSSGSS
ncbi:MAG: bifunctional hydroxymethylpyrimidine kinase/phosphomethylpyrimidine kinase [Clostridiales bacterium]|nr:bifunctional hydroxymethylpyrimidine kinase/phosphomethylpyrimidine kinase [Clostridiales bacterium]